MNATSFACFVSSKKESYLIFRIVNWLGNWKIW